MTRSVVIAQLSVFAHMSSSDHLFAIIHTYNISSLANVYNDG